MFQPAPNLFQACSNLFQACCKPVQRPRACPKIVPSLVQACSGVPTRCQGQHVPSLSKPVAMLSHTCMYGAHTNTHLRSIVASCMVLKILITCMCIFLFLQCIKQQCGDVVSITISLRPSPCTTDSSDLKKRGSPMPNHGIKISAMHDKKLL